MSQLSNLNSNACSYITNDSFVGLFCYDDATIILFFFKLLPNLNPSKYYRHRWKSHKIILQLWQHYNRSHQASGLILHIKSTRHKSIHKQNLVFCTRIKNYFIETSVLEQQKCRVFKLYVSSSSQMSLFLKSTLGIIQLSRLNDIIKNLFW